MKIALASKAVYPARGGVELHVHNLALELAGMGHEVHAFVSTPANGHSYASAYTVHPGTSTAQLPTFLWREKFDVVHAHGSRSPFAACALSAARMLGLHSVFTPHCFYPALDWRGLLKRALFDPTLGAFALHHSDHIICLTENDRRDALALDAPPDKIQIIPNSIRLPEVPSTAEIEGFRRRRGWGSFLLSVGRLDRVKRGDFLIQALTRLPAELRLVFVGPDAGCRETWRALAASLGLKDRALLIEELSDHELTLAYCASTAVVMASLYEGLPTVLLEAMALGTPVIAARSGGVPYLIEHEVNGLLYAGGDLEAYSAQVRRCLAGAAHPLTARAREHVLRNYSWEANARRVAALYERSAH
jgi:glycosyltransferase involved in cell wall biosynthesis